MPDLLQKALEFLDKLLDGGIKTTGLFKKELVKKTLLLIKFEKSGGVTIAGSGLVFMKGIGITARHVAEKGDLIYACIGTQKFSSEILAHSESLDLSVFVLPENLKPLKMGEINDTKVLYSYGLSGMFTKTIKKGSFVQRVWFPIENINLKDAHKSKNPDGSTSTLLHGFKSTLDSKPGDSGGPILNKNGEFVGMVIAAGKKGGSTYAIHTEDILDEIKKIFPEFQKIKLHEK